MPPKATSHLHPRFLQHLKQSNGEGEGEESSQARMRQREVRHLPVFEIHVCMLGLTTCNCGLFVCL